MREIKFRAWDLEKRRWAHPGVVRSQLMQPYMLSVEWRNGVTYLSHECDEGATIELQQYTGLKDKNGVEIWEGDVIRVSPNRAIGIVSWDTSGYWGVKLDGIVYSFASGTDITAHSSKVIGNVYQHPHLLK